jgi:predicted transcriptional regulator of viral defense system
MNVKHDQAHTDRSRASATSRFADLARTGESLFHVDDLANLWSITSPTHLRATVKRYVDRGLLYRIYRGFYALKPLRELDERLVGQKAVHGFAYVTTESVLAAEGVIQQAVPASTLVGERTRHFEIGGRRYLVRQLAPRFLYQPAGVTTMPDGLRIANRERAIADLLYFNAHVYFDAASFIDWDAVRRMQEAVGYPLTPNRYG